MYAQKSKSAPACLKARSRALNHVLVYIPSKPKSLPDYLICTPACAKSRPHTQKPALVPAVPKESLTFPKTTAQNTPGSPKAFSKPLDFNHATIKI